jgi:nucleotide-binding universal stress UspA family protein
MAATDPTVVMVGVDGSPSSVAAVELAAREAVVRGLGLHIVHAFRRSATFPYQEPGAIVEQAVTAACKVSPDIAITSELADGPAASVLLEGSRRAALVVVGDRESAGSTESCSAR